MKKIKNWKLFIEDNSFRMSIKQLNELEEYLYNYHGFDKENLDEDDIEEVKRKFDPESNYFLDFLNSLDDHFDWFDFRMVPEIKEYVSGIIKDYWEVPQTSEGEEVFDIGDLVDFGKWGKVYVIGFDDFGIKATDIREDRFKGSSENEFIIPDNDIDKHEILEKGFNDPHDHEDEDDDWWRK
jgi:hypothetical protein